MSLLTHGYSLFIMLVGACVISVSVYMVVPMVYGLGDRPHMGADEPIDDWSGRDE